MRLKDLKTDCSKKSLILSFVICLGLVLLVVACVATSEPQQKRRKMTRRNCIDCHKDLSEQYQKGGVHAPVKENNCAACHLPHGILGSLLMREYPPGLCFKCHIDIKSKQSGLSVHKPVANGECGACHDPHNSDYPALLQYLDCIFYCPVIISGIIINFCIFIIKGK